MNVPIVIESSSFQDVWHQAVLQLSQNRWSLWDIVAKINNPLELNKDIHNTVTQFAKKNDLILPDQVAYTIFPFKLYKPDRSLESFYKAYWKFFRMTRSMEHSGWGTYFERMIKYPTIDGNIDQLGHIIECIRKNDKVQRAAYTMLFPKPGWENVRPMGAPCLNYVAIREEPVESGRSINLLAVYRNHDFLERAYGNYYGLCKLLEYISTETHSETGSITCVSSHAFVQTKKRDLLDLVSSLPTEGTETYEQTTLT